MPTQPSNQELQLNAILTTCSSILLGENQQQVTRPSFITEADEGLTKTEVERLARKVLKQDLEDEVVKLLKRELKAQSFEDLVVGITCKALSRFWEILFTRRGTWVSQMKGKL